MIYRSIAQLQKKAGSVARVCEVLAVSRSGYYAAQRRGDREAKVCPVSVRLQAAFARSGLCYGSRRLQAALRGEGIKLGRYRVRGLMRTHGLRATWKRKFIHTTDSRHNLPTAANVLDRQFQPAGPNQAWVSDITYLRTRSGWLYLAAVMDLFSRKIVGWAMAPMMTSDLVLQALVAAAWRRKPGPGVMVHSDQGSQFTSSDWQSFLKVHRMVPSMSRRGNCHDNAVAESFFSVLKKERIKRRIYPTRAAATSDVFDYIEMFYNPVRRHGSAGDVSPVEFERRYAQSGR